MWIWISVTTILVSILLFLSWIVYRLVDQNEQYESDLEWFQDWYSNFITILADADIKMKEVDRRGSFESDDEIGFAYQTIKQCMENLNQMGAITYGGEEGQTDSTEEIQGQEEEE